MSQVDMNRIREDLATMKEATGVGLPFGREEIWFSLAYAAVGCAVAAWLAFGPSAYAWLAIVPFVLVMAAAVPVAIKRGPVVKRDVVRSRELRRKGILMLVVWPLLAAFWIWGTMNEVPIEIRISAIAFFMGMCTLVFSIIDRTQLYRIGAGVSAIFLGVIYAPCARNGYGYLALCGCLTVAALLTAAIMTWQLRTNVSSHATH